MPSIELIPEVFYQPTQPYNYIYDNLPLENIVLRTQLINFAVDQNSQVLRESIGTQGTLSNRLAQSMNPDGSLREDAIDNAMHNIGAHTEGQFDGIDYVIMMLTERDKLALIASEATSFRLAVEETISATPSVIPVFDNTLVTLAQSDSISWEVTPPATIRAHMNFPVESAHKHYYNVIPASAVVIPNYIDYKVLVPFVDGSLRVYINGVRLNESATVKVLVGGVLKPLKYTVDLDGMTLLPTGFFSLNLAITSTDVIRVDFDVSFI
jgi:hypothetical protein